MPLGDHVKRSLVASLALSFWLVAFLVPAAFAADPTVVESAAPSDPGVIESATPGESAVPAPDPTVDPIPTDGATPPGGEISVDPSFEVPSADATSTPEGAVLGATGRPETTLPPTDAGITTATNASVSLQALLVGLAVVSFTVLLAGRRTAVRRA
jgi:hypothetical protein